MIDPLNEEIIHAREAAKLFPRGANGKHPHVSKIYRLMKTGSRGVVLESIRTPRLATSREAVGRFMRSLSELDPSATPQNHRPTSRDSADHAVERELDRLGI